jgi:hypothetical protein
MLVIVAQPSWNLKLIMTELFKILIFENLVDTMWGPEWKKHVQLWKVFSGLKCKRFSFYSPSFTDGVVNSREPQSKSARKTKEPVFLLPVVWAEGILMAPRWSSYLAWQCPDWDWSHWPELEVANFNAYCSQVGNINEPGSSDVRYTAAQVQCWVT